MADIGVAAGEDDGEVYLGVEGCEAYGAVEGEWCFLCSCDHCNECVV